jgi:uncharacterized protein YkwD
MAEERTFAAWRRLAAGAVVAGSILLVAGRGAGAEPCAPAVLGCSPVTTPTTTSSSTTTSTTAPQPSGPDAVARLVERTNAERTQRGLPPLQVRADVTSIAGAWSDSMARAARLSHDDAYFSPDSHHRLDAQLLGENVARAPDVDVAHAALMNSEHHRANILDSRFTTIGIGATFVDSTWWITEDFLQPSAPAPRRAAHAARASAPRAARPTTTTSTTVTTAPVLSPAVFAVSAAPAERVVVLPRVDRPVVADLADGDGHADAPRAAAALAATLVVALGLSLARQLRRR